jgi:hypothetical protein
MRALQDIIKYNIEVKYLPGAKNYVQDALSQRLDYQEPPLPRAMASRREEESMKWAEKARAKEVSGEVLGDILGKVSGEVPGEVSGEVAGEVSGEVGVREVSGEVAGEGSGEGSGVSLGFGMAEVTHGKLFSLVVLEGEEWRQRVREGYQWDTYF